MLAFLLISTLSLQQDTDRKQEPRHAMHIKRKEATPQGAILKKLCVRVVRQQEVAAVPEVRGGGPFESQTGHINGGVHQQEENGHNAGNGVELPREKDQLVESRESGGGG